MLNGYTVRQIISENVNSTVVIAQNTVTDETHLIKHLKYNYRLEVKKKSYREMNVLTSLDHPNIARPINVVLGDDGLSMIYAFEPGQSLYQKISNSNYKLGITEIFQIMVKLLNALSYLHIKGIVHADISPHNIYIDENNKLKLLDFGNAMHLEDAEKITEEVIVGTFPYLSPEQMGFTRFKIDTRTDLYCATIIFYQMIAGDLPFLIRGESIKELLDASIKREIPAVKHAPQIVNEILLKGLRPTPIDRYQTAEGMLYDILSIVNSPGTLNGNFKIGNKDAISAINRKRFFILRENELDALGNIYRRGDKSSGCSILVYGKSGMGKTELIKEFRKTVDENANELLLVKCNKFTPNQPYSIFRQIVIELLSRIELKELKAQSTFKSEIDKELRTYSGTICGILPEMVKWFESVEEEKEVEKEKEADRMVHVLTQFMSVLCRCNIVIVVIDDFQWVDRTTFKIIVNMIELKFPGMLICNYRTSDEQDAVMLYDKNLEQIGFGCQIHLKEFSRCETEKYLCKRIDIEQCSQVVLDNLHKKSGGSPYILTEVVRYLVNNQVIRRDENKWKIDENEIKLLPDKYDIISLVLDKFNKLTDCEKSFLQVAALIEGRIDLGIVGKILGISEIQRKEIADKIEASGLLIAHFDQKYTFVHDKLQEIISSEMPAGIKTEKYLLLGDIYREMSNNSGDAIFNAAECFLKSNNMEKAIEACLESAKCAKEKKAFDIAIRYFKKITLLYNNAKDKLGSLRLNIVDVNILFGDVLMLTGANEQALKLLAIVRSDVNLTNAQKLEIQYKIGTIYRNLGEFEKSSLYFIQTLNEIGIKIAKNRAAVIGMTGLEILKRCVLPKFLLNPFSKYNKQEIQVIVRILNKLSYSLFFYDMIKGYYSHFKAFNLSELLQDCSEKADAYIIHQIGQYQIGFRKSAFKHLEIGQKLAHSIKRNDTLAFAKSFGGLITYYNSFWDKSYELLKDSNRLYSEMGDINNQIINEEHLWKIAFLRGQFDQIVNTMDRTIELCKKLNEKYYLVVTLSAKNLVKLIRDGKLDEHEYQEIHQRLKEVDAILFHMESGGYLLSIEIEIGNHQRAYDRATKLLPLTLMKCVNSEYQVKCFSSFCSLLVKELLARKRLQSNIAVSPNKIKKQWFFYSLIYWFSCFNYPAYWGCFFRNLAWFCTLHNFKRLSHLFFKKAVKAHHKLDMRYEEACSIRDYGLFLDEYCNLPGDARDHYNSAYKIFVCCGAKLETDRLEDRIDPEKHAVYLESGDTDTVRTSGSTSSGVNLLRFETLVDVSKTITETDDPAILLRQILSAMITATGAQYGYLFINKNAYDDFELIAMSFEGNEVAVADVPVFRDLIEKVNDIHTLQCTGETDLDDDIETNSSYIRSDLCVPLNWRDKYLGYVYLVNDRVRGLFGEGAQKAAMVLAAHAGILLENANLIKKQKQFNVELQRQVESQTDDLKQKHQQLEVANLRLIESERMKGILSGTLVHDIKNYAAGITGNLMYLDRRLEDDPKAHRIIDVVHETCIDITSLASNLLDIAKMDDGKMIVREETLEFDFFEAMAEKFGRTTLFEEKGISPKIVASSDEFSINADVYLMERVLQNLYSNASKYAPKGSVVELRLFSENNEDIVCFFNSGPPIPDSEKVILFEKYARIQSRQSPYSKGLGLFFCRMVMHAHGGRIWLDTGSEGNYFKLAFPRQYRQLKVAS